MKNTKGQNCKAMVKTIGLWDCALFWWVCVFYRIKELFDRGEKKNILGLLSSETIRRSLIAHKAGLKTRRTFLLLRLVSRGRGNSLIQHYPTSWIPLWFTLALQSFFSRKHSTVWSEVKLILCSQYTPSQQIRVKWSWKWLDVTVDFCEPIVDKLHLLP